MMPDASTLTRLIVPPGTTQVDRLQVWILMQYSMFVDDGAAQDRDQTTLTIAPWYHVEIGLN